MLLEEAEWIREMLEQIIRSGNIRTVLNIGSSTVSSWETEQPHINSIVINRLKEANIRLYNTDIKKGEGVDFVGDLCDDNFIADLAEKEMDIIVCANVLEHVKDPVKVSVNITRLTKKNGYAIVTVPFIYPYHPDPEDYLFRPGEKGIRDLFNEMDCLSVINIKGRRAIRTKMKMVYCRNYFATLTRDVRLLMLTAIRILAPFYKYRNWKRTSRYLPKLFKDYTVTCALFIKK